MRKNGKGFTLIELLVVIAIIAILAAILFPVFARARENARKSTCQNNLKQIGTAIMQYTQDYDEKVPCCRMGDGPNPLDGNKIQTLTWAVIIQPYLKNVNVLTCPSNPTTDTSGWANYGQSGGFKHHYGYPTTGDNTQTAGFSYQPGGNGASLAMIQSPAQTLQIVESSVNSPDVAGWNSQNVFYGHSGMANFLFCDGHVKTMKWIGVYTPVCMFRFDGAVQSTWANNLPAGAR